MNRRRRAPMLRGTRLLVWLFAGLLAACMSVDDAHTSVTIKSLDDLSINTLRRRSYGSSMSIEAKPAHHEHDTFIASYFSDGLSVYSIIVVPAFFFSSRRRHTIFLNVT